MKARESYCTQQRCRVCADQLAKANRRPGRRRTARQQEAQCGKIGLLADIIPRHPEGRETETQRERHHPLARTVTDAKHRPWLQDESQERGQTTQKRRQGRAATASDRQTSVPGRMMSAKMGKDGQAGEAEEAGDGR